jgi:hypothetical protein
MTRSRWPSMLRGTLRLAAVACLTLPLLFASAQANMTPHGGPVMVNQVKTFLIYWTPTGVVLDSSVTDGTGNFRTLSQQFYGDVSGSDYMNIVTQYPGTCSGSPCVLSNGADAVKNIGVWVDTQAYPHPGVNNDSGTQANPLTDADIQNEVTRAIGQNHWTVDANSIFFVITGIFSSNGKLVEECAGAECTFNAFCAYHSQFSLTFYSFLSDASFARGGCDEGIPTAVNTQIASDREVALMTHEFMETVTDPQTNAWFQGNTAGEIGDLCNQISGELTRNGHTYAVQQQWSNASSSCVSSYFVQSTINFLPIIELILKSELIPSNVNSSPIIEFDSKKTWRAIFPPPL